MNKKMTRVVALAMTVAVMSSLLVGCGGSQRSAYRQILCLSLWNAVAHGPPPPGGGAGLAAPSAASPSQAVSPAREQGAHLIDLFPLLQPFPGLALLRMLCRRLCPVRR